jgi:hypothetical protein
MNEIAIENELIILSTETIVKLFNYDNWADLVSLYIFYNYQCSKQGTNKILSTSDFTMESLKIWEGRFLKAKKMLKELDLIEDVKERGKDWKLWKSYILLKFWH